MMGIRIAITLGVLCILGSGPNASATLLYSASLKNGSYGGGFIVDTFAYNTCGDADGSSCGDGNLSNIGITNSPNGVTYTSNNAVINYSIGRDHGSATQTSFRSQGTASVRFRADNQTHVNGSLFGDNYGFNQFYDGQGSYGSGLSRNLGADGIAKTSDDRVLVGWSTWHNNVWYAHPNTTLVSYDEWHDLGLAWGGLTNDFEIWVDGVLIATHNLPTGVINSWGSSGLGLGSAYNFALGDIHQRGGAGGATDATTYGVMFSDIEIWNEYLAQGGTASPVPEPATLLLLGSGLAGLGGAAWRRKKKESAPSDHIDDRL